MSKYGFVLFAAQREDFVERLRELGLVDITTAGWEPSEEDRQLMLDIEGHTKAADFIRTYREDAAQSAFAAAATPFASGAKAYEHYAAAQQQAAALHGELARLEKAASELRPWGAFDPAQTQALAEQGVVLRYFSTPANNFEKMQAEWSAQYTLSLIAEVDSQAYFVVVTTSDEEVSIDAQEMKTPTSDIRETKRQIAEVKAKLATLSQTEFARVAASEALLAANAAALKEHLQSVRVEATATEAADGQLLVMEGWAEKATSTQVDALLEAYPNVVYLKGDPTPDDNTPVKLHNGWFSRIFELVGDMYARPKYGTLDLTPFFAPFYMLFFGICLNDAGYGLILLGLGLWMLRKNPTGMMHRAALFATMCAVATVAVGAFCGSFFGISMGDYFHAIPFFDFQGRFFSIALAIGMVQILFGMLLNIWMTARSFGIRYSFGVMGWFIILVAASVAGGLSMLNPAWVIPWFTISSPAFYAVAGVGAVLMFLFNTPGRNPLLNIGAGVWNFYNNLTGLLSDVLSYIRLFAIGLSGGVLAVVFNSLADGFVPEGSNIVVRILVMLPILLIGHGINLFMSTISSFVHPMRLTFVEFYKNAGFEMATRYFEPIRKMEKTDK